MKISLNNGFSLIELMIVVFIIGVLSAIAVPNYQEYVAKSKRSDAQADLLAVANAMERNFTAAGRYDQLPDGNAVTVTGVFGRDTVGGDSVSYNLTLPVLARNNYTLRATPTGSQSNDSCGVLSLTSTGIRDAVKDGNPVPNCWR